MTEILKRRECNFIKDLIIKRRMQTHTHSKNNFSNDHNLEQPCNLVVKTNNVPIWTFLHFFVWRTLKCKILLISEQAFYFQKMIFFNWNPGYLKCVFLSKMHVTWRKYISHINILVRQIYNI